MSDDTTGTHKAQFTPQSNPALAALEILVGTWEIEGVVEEQLVGGGRTTFEWLAGGPFLVQQGETEQAEFPNTIAVFGRDDYEEMYRMLYFDSRGVSRIYQMSLN